MLGGGMIKCTIYTPALMYPVVVREPSTSGSISLWTTTFSVSSSPSMSSAAASTNNSTTGMTDAQVAKEMDVPAVEATRSYRQWQSLPEGDVGQNEVSAMFGSSGVLNGSGGFDVEGVRYISTDDRPLYTACVQEPGGFKSCSI